jgi:hypothetical protein
MTQQVCICAISDCTLPAQHCALHWQPTEAPQINGPSTLLLLLLLLLPAPEQAQMTHTGLLST